MLYLAFIMISSVDLAHYGVSRSKDWVSLDCGTRRNKYLLETGYNDRIPMPQPKYSYIQLGASFSSLKFVDIFV